MAPPDFIPGKLREDLPPLPDRIKALPVALNGYPVPYFVKWIDGKPEFRVMSEHRFVECLIKKLCWVCGGELGTYLAFTIGPMCSINRASGEPPSHRECAKFSATACPFLTKPHMTRREEGLPENRKPSPGIEFHHNPGATAVWITRGFQRFTPPGGGTMFRVGEPTEVLWFTLGRKATRAEVQAALEPSLAKLRELADTDVANGIADAHSHLDTLIKRAAPFLPKV